METETFVTASLAVWYISHIITQTKGPFGIFEMMREEWPHGGVLDCRVCAAFWLALVVYLLTLAGAAVILLPFALAGLALMLGSWTGANHN